MKELYTFCRVPLVVIHPRRNCAHDKMRIMNSNFGLQNLMEKAPPLAATLHIPPAMCDGGHNKLKNRTIQTFLCIQSPDVFNETCYFLESVQSSYKEREKKTQLAKKTSKCHHHYRQKKDFTSVLVLSGGGGKRDRCRPTRSPITILPSLLDAHSNF